MPQQTTSQVYAWATHTGLVRQVNEDAGAAREHVLVVADGLGGHGGGDVASRLLVDEFRRLDDVVRTTDEATDVVVGALARARARLQSWIDAQPEDQRVRAATTVVAALRVSVLGGRAWHVTHLGDSRAYLADAAGWRPLTRDHSVVEELVSAGAISAEEARTHPERNVVTRALSTGDLPDVDAVTVPCSPGSRLVLCTDGVCGVLEPDELERLATTGRPQDAVEAVLTAVLSAGAPDNATVVISDVV